MTEKTIKLFGLGGPIKPGEEKGDLVTKSINYYAVCRAVLVTRTGSANYQERMFSDFPQIIYSRYSRS